MKTNLGLVEYCKNQLGKPYWWGTFGQIASENLYNQKKKQYPKYYTANDFKSQYGVKVHDCVGLIKGYLWSDGNKLTYNAGQDKDVGGMKNTCFAKGTIDTLPDELGVLVFMKGHVGVYIGNGEVIEAKGHAYGVVKTKLKGRGWTEWGKTSYIKYEVEKMTQEEQINIIKDKAGLSDKTIEFLLNYRYGDDLVRKLAYALRED